MADYNYLLFFINVVVCIAVGYGVPFSRDQELTDGNQSYGNKVKNLQDKLQILQKMLSEIKQYQTKDHRITSGLRTVSPSGHARLHHTTDRQAALQKMAVKLSRDNHQDESSLQLLENALQRLQNRNNNVQMFKDSVSDPTGEDLGKFDDGPVETSQQGFSKDESTSTEDMIFAILQRLLHPKNTQTRGLPHTESQAHELRPVIKEGQFGNFGEQALHNVENQLLDDLNQASRDGITVDDIVKDTQKGSRTDNSWTKRQGEIERELDTLLTQNKT